MTHAALGTSSLSFAPGPPRLARSNTRLHTRGDSARKLVITAGIFDGLFGGGKGAAKVYWFCAAYGDKG